MPMSGFAKSWLAALIVVSGLRCREAPFRRNSGAAPLRPTKFSPSTAAPIRIA